MRYQNWDVLLFPETSKTPIQEFKTQCFVTKDNDSVYLSATSVGSLPFDHTRRPTAQLPVLTSFVPSLMQNAAFRVSIHTWDRPKVSRVTEAVMQPEDSVAWEARVYVDGVFITGSIFDSRSSWPQVINTSSQLDKDGNQDLLRFPPFHQEILQQSHWDAGEMLGRIRVVIAEGFARLRRSPPFERMKDIVAFSFQHAPLHVLEYSAIAWPNAGMWAQARQTHATPVPNVRYNRKNDEEAHAHSPQRATGSRGSGQPDSTIPTGSSWQTKPMNPSTMSWNVSPRTNLEAMADPFVDVAYQPPRPNQPRRTHLSSTDDVSMPDYGSHSESSSSRPISSMTGVSYEKPRSTNETEDAAIAELVEALSPLKGTHAPSNSPLNEQTLPIVPRPSAAAEARSASYSSVRGKKEARDKENVSSTKSSRLSSQASQSRLETVKGIDEPLAEGKRKRSAASTPESRKLSDNRSISPSASKAAVNSEKVVPPKNEQSNSNTLQVPVTVLSLEDE